MPGMSRPVIGISTYREQARFGDTASKEERYARTDEFLSVVRGTWTQAPFDFHGRFFDAEGAQVSGGIDPVPQIYFGGSSGPAGPDDPPK